LLVKTIGILGGLGPQATTDFIDRIHRVSQKLIPPKTNSGYPPLLVYYFRHAPMLLDERHMPIEPWKPDPRLFEAAKLLRGADFLAIPSNAPHMFREGIETAAETPILSIIDQALAEVERRGWKRVGVVGMGEPLVYTVPMKKKGLDCETLASDPDLRSQLDVAILKVMEGGEGDAERALARKAIEHVRSKKVDGVILGCTELPLLLGAAAEASEFVNTTQVLAEAAVRRAIA
jgi:aspartate racemase